MKKLIALVFIALPLAACATLFGGGGSQTMNIMTHDDKPAKAKIVNGSNSFAVTLPTSVQVKRKNSPIMVNIIADDNTQNTLYTVEQRINIWALVDLFGGVFSTTTDLATGAAWCYDEGVIVPVTRVPSENKQQNGL